MATSIPVDNESGKLETSARLSSPKVKHAKEQGEHVIPDNNIPLVFVSLMLAAFLVALDQTIVATALPTIAAQLGGGKDYSWVGSAYLIAGASLSPAYGKLSDIFGRKKVLYPSILIFLVGSALCGAAKSMTWLILARVFQGVGGGGLQQMVLIIISDIVSLEQRGKYQAFSGSMWAIASVVGPVVGGALTDHASWRWCFWINLPTGGLASILLFQFLNLNPHQGKTLIEHVREFDFVALFLIVGGVVCLLLGFNQSQNGWDRPDTISLLVVGLATIVSGVVFENWTTRSPIIPPRLFKTRTTALLFFVAFFHYFTFFSATFYVPLYYQIRGASATKSGALFIPFAILSSATSALGGYAVSKMGDFRQTIMALGYGLMIMLNERSSMALQIIYPAIAALGAGGLFVPPLIGIQAAMPVRDMATSSATFGLVRLLGSTIGISVGQAIWTGVARSQLSKIPNLTLELSGAALTDSIRAIQNIEPESLRNQVLHAYTKGVSTIWLVFTPILCVCLAATLLLKNYSLKRNIIRTGKTGPAEPPSSLGDDVERGADDKDRTEEDAVVPLPQ
ncbi:MFS amino acid permease [Mycena vulgaris]|nr:MFS amino acid permease [Mycena vulgaris]